MTPIEYANSLALKAKAKLQEAELRRAADGYPFRPCSVPVAYTEVPGQRLLAEACERHGLELEYGAAFHTVRLKP